MCKYNFDEIINRYNTNSLKWDYAEKRGKPKDILPLWVADMDFRCPNEVIDTLINKSKHGIFGYSEPLDSYFEALKSWFLKHYDYEVDTNKIVLAPGVVFAISNIIEALTKENDSIMINEPVYYPFKEMIITNNRKLIISELININGKYQIDFNDFEKKIIDNNVKLYILCNPHNPVGRVWSIEELNKIYEICKRNNVFIISDEIHADFVYKGYKFNSIAKLGNDALNNIIIATSPSKTFNVAGLHNANIYIYNDDIRNKYLYEQNKRGYSQSNVMGIVACEACYKYGDEWLNELLEYLENNLKYLRKYLKEKLPFIDLIEPEGTYLIWLDFRKLNLSIKEEKDLIVYKAKLWLDPGQVFGKSGIGFERINIATPQKILKKALDQLYNAIKDLGINGNN